MSNPLISIQLDPFTIIQAAVKKKVALQEALAELAKNHEKNHTEFDSYDVCHAPYRVFLEMACDIRISMSKVEAIHKAATLALANNGTIEITEEGVSFLNL